MYAIRQISSRPAFLVTPALQSLPLSSPPRRYPFRTRRHPQSLPCLSPHLWRPHPHPLRQFTMTTPLPSPLSLPSPPASVAGFNPVMAQAMLRIRSPLASSHFYHDLLGMTLVTRLDFPDLSFSLFFYAYTNDDPPALSLPQAQRAQWLWSRPYPTVELTWNWPGDSATYEDAIRALEGGDMGDEEYVSGNEQGALGFSYLGVTVEKLGDALAALGEGVNVVDKGEGFFFVKDPDGYHVRLEGRKGGPGARVPQEDPVFGKVVVRVKDVRQAVTFFGKLGFQVVARVDGEGVTQVWMGYVAGEGLRGNASSSANSECLLGRRECLVGLVHEWGTEQSEGPVYQNGNVRPYRGFGHVGIVVDDIYETVQQMGKEGYQVVRKPGPFKDVGEIAFVAEPSSGYWVEVIKRGGEAAREPYAKPLPV